ncbi:hypothetical protein RFI_35235 [Reticulomyxa filosa]|uniref:Uncharacterized protein n=1 Tax=Reticulomyxa filosa TaxID=46433 RepID=X6LLF4_RETFI|nr:hypothetical protein RFI_35235 [Reticulomyxa filosa]|eukprot:ETO02201.1 hypothetical protein RFI_35235 [Reticulomyxa filosa]
MKQTDEKEKLLTIFHFESYWQRDSISYDELKTLWDGSICAMVQLMNEAYERFVVTDAFKHVVKYFAHSSTPLSLNVKNVVETVVSAITPHNKIGASVNTSSDAETDSKPLKAFFEVSET